MARSGSPLPIMASVAADRRRHATCYVMRSFSFDSQWPEAYANIFLGYGRASRVLLLLLSKLQLQLQLDRKSLICRSSRA